MKDKMVPVLVVLLVIAAFVIGMFYGKETVYKEVGRVAGVKQEEVEPMGDNQPEEFYKKELPFFYVSSLPVYYVDDFGVVDPEDLKTSEEGFLTELRARKMKEKEQLLNNVVEEYKSERRRGIYKDVK